METWTLHEETKAKGGEHLQKFQPLNLHLHDFEVACNPDINNPHFYSKSSIENNYVYKGSKLSYPGFKA